MNINKITLALLSSFLVINASAQELTDGQENTNSTWLSYSWEALSKFKDGVSRVAHGTYTMAENTYNYAFGSNKSDPKTKETLPSPQDGTSVSNGSNSTIPNHLPRNSSNESPAMGSNNSKIPSSKNTFNEDNGCASYFCENNQISSSIGNLENHVAQVENKINHVEKMANRGIASVAALSGTVSMPSQPGKFVSSAAVATYAGVQGFAVNFAYRPQTVDALSFQGGVGTSGGGKAVYRAGVAFEF
jgi:hypothetical protein